VAHDRNGQILEQANFKNGKLIGAFALLGAGAAAAYDGQGDEDLDENEFDRMLKKLGDFEKKVEDRAETIRIEDQEDDEEED